ncbi:MAG: hypothetical protein HY361_03030 [Candidatus Aenigmarchaeota archaeon]|nr:hypothetical protein [Candidatus Aenigmarchaeota archaeon]
MKFNLIKLVVATVFLIVAFSYALATSVDDIVYPVKELSNCKSYEQCASYCDDVANSKDCIAFAKKHNLKYNEFEDIVKYPVAELGNCASFEECSKYCENPDNLGKCVDLAESYGIISERLAHNGRAMISYLKAGTTPGGCYSESECRAYCFEQESRFGECLKFITEAGIITLEEAELAGKVGGKGPGGCTTKVSCEKYCADASHAEECLSFAEKYGFISKEDAENARKFGVNGGPGGCKSEQACTDYCAKEENLDVCATFMLEKGVMSAQEVENFKKFAKVGFKGPGGCKTEKDCRDYCNKDEAFVECTEFAKVAGFISEEEYQKAKQYGAAGKKFLEQGGPGGCKSQQECEVYCKDIAHITECEPFAKEYGVSIPDISKIPEPCRKSGMSIEACTEFCKSNPEACGIPVPKIPPPDVSGGSSGSAQEACKARGIQSYEECTSFCRSNPADCGISIPSYPGYP